MNLNKRFFQLMLAVDLIWVIFTSYPAPETKVVQFIIGALAIWGMALDELKKTPMGGTLP